MTLRLVIFDVDGTLVDSQGDILSAMRTTYHSAGLTAPSRQDILSIVGLSLPQVMQRLAPEQSPDTHLALIEGYKVAYNSLRSQGGVDSSPLYPGMAELIDRLHAVDDVLLGIATGKSRRGLTALLDGHNLSRHFVTTQVADDHPSKPHPSMILTAMTDTGVEAQDVVMIGDTTYDMEMAQYAGVAAIGVEWGYHAQEKLAGFTHCIVSDATALEKAIFDTIGAAT